MAVIISGTSGIDMGNNPVSNASQIDGAVINENGSNVISQGELAYNADTSSFIPNTLASGAIIERGSNANGSYIKFADGTLVASTTYTLGVSNTAVGSIFRGVDMTVPLPIEFSSVENAIAGFFNDSSSTQWASFRAATNMSVTLFRITSNSVTTNNTAKITVFGRWK